jgi:hypothetical protein
MPTLIAMEIPPLPPLAGSEPEPNISAEVDNASSEQGNDAAAEALLLFAIEVSLWCGTLLWSAKLMSFQLSDEKRIIEKNIYFSLIKSILHVIH